VIRLVAIDVDGTLLDSAYRLQATVADALSELDARGVRVALATARSPQVTRVVLRQVKLVPLLVCFSGAWIGEVNLQSPMAQKTLWEKRHTAAAARLIVETALSCDVEPNVFTPETWRVRTLTNEILGEIQITETHPDVTEDLLGGDGEPSKILLMTAEGEATKKLHAIAKVVRPVSNATFSKPNYLEVIPLGVNKADGLANLTKMLGMDLSHVAALGDGHNDVEMLREVGLGIAMGNASDEVKAAAKWVTGTNDEAGVAQAIRKLFRENAV
jgi:Cof subfamily protein (haloacid dehalogenase superfamily)